MWQPTLTTDMNSLPTFISTICSSLSEHSDKRENLVCPKKTEILVDIKQCLHKNYTCKITTI